MAREAVERKLTTILEADVAGYSAMMADDEEATLRTLDIYRQIIDGLIEKHGGRIVSTAGDSVLAEFGSPVEAVRCAISAQEDMAVRNAELPEERQMWFRIGINVGDVMAENDDLFGDGVNVAARLESLAEPGGVCISGSTFEFVKNKLSVGFEDMGPQAVKNIPSPVPAFRIVGGAVHVSPKSAIKNHKNWLAIFTSAAAILIALAGAGLWSFWPLDESPQPKDQAPAPAVKTITAKPAPEPPAAKPEPKPAAPKPAPQMQAPVPVPSVEKSGVMAPKPPVKTSSASSRNMSAAEIKKMVAGIMIKGTTRKRPRSFTMFLNRSGGARVSVNRKGRRPFDDNGKWWTSDGRFCVQFNRFSNGRRMCPEIVKRGGGFIVISGDGTRLNWKIRRP